VLLSGHPRSPGCLPGSPISPVFPVLLSDHPPFAGCLSTSLLFPVFKNPYLTQSVVVLRALTPNLQIWPVTCVIAALQQLNTQCKNALSVALDRIAELA